MTADQQEAVVITCVYAFAYSLLVTVLVCGAIAVLDRWWDR